MTRLSKLERGRSLVEVSHLICLVDNISCLMDSKDCDVREDFVLNKFVKEYGFCYNDRINLNNVTVKYY